MTTPTTRDIIAALGGTEFVADKICAERKIVDNWLRPTRRIGSTYWIDILELARRQRIAWITPQLLKEAKGAYAKDRA